MQGRCVFYKHVFFVLACFVLGFFFAPKLIAMTHKPAAHQYSLLEAYQDALKNDPTFQEQVANYLSSAQVTPLARAVLLPQLNLTAASSGSRQDTTFNGVDRFNTSNYSIALTQTVFNATSFKELARAKAEVREAAASLASEQQSLIVRVSRAYFLALSAKQILIYTGQQKSFLTHQLWVTQERFKHGHGTVTDVDQSKGSLALIRSQYISAKINFYNRLQDLSTITGKPYKTIVSLKNDFPLINPKPLNRQAWVRMAAQNNLSLYAARLNVTATREAIGVAKGNFWPKIEAAMRWSDSNGLGTVPGTANQAEENTRTGVVELRGTWSAFQSGLTVAQVRRASADYQGSIARMHNAYLEALAQARKAFVGVADGAKRVYRGKLAVRYNANALRHSEEGFRAGTHLLLMYCKHKHACLMRKDSMPMTFLLIC